MADRAASVRIHRGAGEALPGPQPISRECTGEGKRHRRGLNRRLLCRCDEIDRLHILGRRVDQTCTLLSNSLAGRPVFGRKVVIGSTQSATNDLSAHAASAQTTFRRAPECVLDLERDRVLARHRRRGTHVLKALSLEAKAVGVGRYYLFPLAAAGQAGVERALGHMRAEIGRDMKLMGCRSIDELSRKNLRFR
jgi:FMN-dependent dehydrogenase